ncbi:GM19471 [Drosophila sechellia]|uniref:GM19471 n=1 Tax=Drosophila sechellia TaxID=7238 RepID=B4HPV0_DROSE|nr:GM19471 [Drosophila sechellia]
MFAHAIWLRLAPSSTKTRAPGPGRGPGLGPETGTGSGRGTEVWPRAKEGPGIITGTNRPSRTDRKTTGKSTHEPNN